MHTDSCTDTQCWDWMLIMWETRLKQTSAPTVTRVLYGCFVSPVSGELHHRGMTHRRCVTALRCTSHYVGAPFLTGAVTRTTTLTGFSPANTVSCMCWNTQPCNIEYSHLSYLSYSGSNKVHILLTPHWDCSRGNAGKDMVTLWLLCVVIDCEGAPSEEKIAFQSALSVFCIDSPIVISSFNEPTWDFSRLIDKKSNDLFNWNRTHGWGGAGTVRKQGCGIKRFFFLFAHTKVVYERSRSFTHVFRYSN